ARGPDEGGRACRLVDREKAPRVRFGYAVAKPWAIRRRAEQQCLRDIKCNARGGRWDRTRGARAGGCQLVTRPRLIDAEISERGDPANERDLLGPGECGTRSARACKDRHRNTVCCRGRDRGDTVLLRKRHFHRGCYEGACWCGGRLLREDQLAWIHGPEVREVRGQPTESPRGHQRRGVQRLRAQHRNGALREPSK